MKRRCRLQTCAEYYFAKKMIPIYLVPYLSSARIPPAILSPCLRRSLFRGSMGKETVKTEPAPGSESTMMEPRCLSIMPWQMERPSPVPLPSPILPVHYAVKFFCFGREPFRECEGFLKARFGVLQIIPDVDVEIGEFHVENMGLGNFIGNSTNAAQNGIGAERVISGPLHVCQ